ncbi:hypothetical protein FDA94_13765 [Herbidospora galbida]|uniref:Uncharacterized protein n=1 Tax=Herbidospora galbida TaxID=2575442 RepID=A0A4U3MGE4_9ACTN|nr:hypothetical protein [Herbidospora galbida]TKK88365.1 hypothetical protein FDA94_13765 [Herbidospora galbida]
MVSVDHAPSAVSGSRTRSSQTRASRRRRRHARPRQRDDAEPAIEKALHAALTEADSAVLRSEIADALREIGAVRVALDAANDDIRADLVTGFADLSATLAVRYEAIVQIAAINDWLIRLRTRPRAVM